MSSDLLDTNTCVQYLRGRDTGLIRRMKTRRPDEIRVCSVVVAELYYGIFKGSQVYRARNLATLDLFLKPLTSLPFDDASALVFGLIRADLASRGAMIGPHDLQIAAIALVHGLTLVTYNTREFSNVPGLALDDWQTIP